MRAELETVRTLAHGASMMGCWVAALYFLRFWKTSRDRLFAFFAVAFVLLSVNWAAINLLRADDERRTLLFGLRLAAFLLILYGIWDKNRLRRDPGA